MKTPRIEQGKVIVAEPFLHDPYFKRAVVLFVEHSKQGTMGFVINSPSNIKVSDAIKDFPKVDLQVFSGGPVDNDIIFYVHTLEKEIPNSTKIRSGIFWGGDFSSVQQLAKDNKLNNNNIRFFMGYAGWGPSQIREEMKKNSWFCFPCKKEYVFFNSPRQLWGKILKDNDSPFSVLSNFSDTPSLN
jgi:putative transcriptional regulator